MKKILATLLFFASGLLAGAQQYQQDKGNSSMLSFPSTSMRAEIIIPDVNGYKVVKADLHSHTIFSDGSVTPQFRVTEAWQDGLDAIAITDHIEHRPTGKLFKEDVFSDLNHMVRKAESKAKNLGITVIPGIEITRDPVKVGHFNALFTTDNNLIPDPDPVQAIRNAKKQGAIVQNNHPGWRRENNDFTEVTKAAIGEGLIDGVEVFNDVEFYPDVIETAVEKGFYVSSGSDVHSACQDQYGKYGFYRNMTLILAKDASRESIREALENKRTLAYGFGQIAGSESLLKDFFLASVSFTLIRTDAKGVTHVQVTNNSSLPYKLSLPGFALEVTLPALSSIRCQTNGKEIPVTVNNMWLGADKHLELIIKL